MPELPEVETIVTTLQKQLIGKKIIDLWTDTPKIIKDINLEKLLSDLKNKTFSKVERRGKNILLEINKEFTLWVHLKMTGHLLLRPTKYFELESLSENEKSPFSEKVNQYIHFRFILSNKEELAFSDLRKFGRIRFINQPINSKINNKYFPKLGIEPFDKNFNLKTLKNIAGQKKNKNKDLKIFLMDQENIAGIGNIYASEICFDAKISPKKKMSDISDPELKKIIKSTQKILGDAIKQKGTSISDYRMPSGEKGNYQEVRRVYQRKGQPCIKCKGVVESFKQGQRTTFWCPKCQK